MKKTFGKIYNPKRIGPYHYRICSIINNDCGTIRKINVVLIMKGLNLNMKDNFWRDLPRPFFILAPMEDVTDVVFRHVVSEAAKPDVFFTEFTNTESYCHPEGRKVCVVV